MAHGTFFWAHAAKIALHIDGVVLRVVNDSEWLHLGIAVLQLYEQRACN